MKQLLDLRFTIGLFFWVIGLLLCLYSSIKPGSPVLVNIYCSVLFMSFGIAMLTSSLVNKRNSQSK